MASPKVIERIYTDGACSGNPGPGGWATVVYFADGSVHEIGGAERDTTNNRMELQGAIAALEYLLQTYSAKTTLNDPISLYTDSEYVKNGITQWVKGWKRKGWKTAAGKPVLNQDLWEKLDALNSQMLDQLGNTLQWKYVKGHSGNVGNDRCDAIARAFATGKTPALAILEATQVAMAQAEARSPLTLSSNGSDTNSTDGTNLEAVQSSHSTGDSPSLEAVMLDSATSPSADASDVPREIRVTQLRHLVETLHMADEIAKQGYLITSSELADLMDVNASAVTSRGDNWVWRNWVVSRVRREGNQILWQLERVD